MPEKFERSMHKSQKYKENKIYLLGECQKFLALHCCGYFVKMNFDILNSGS